MGLFDRLGTQPELPSRLLALHGIARFKYVDIAIIYHISGHTGGPSHYSFYPPRPPSTSSFLFSFAGGLPLSSHFLNCSGFSFRRVPDKIVFLTPWLTIRLTYCQNTCLDLIPFSWVLCQYKPSSFKGNIKKIGYFNVYHESYA